MAEPSEDAAPSAEKIGKASLSLRLCCAAIVIGGILAFPWLGRDVFWHDEAHNALFARNLVNLGAPTAWDGKNLITYGGGSELNEDLEFVRAPPLEQYVAAAGIALLGDSRFGARAPFVAIGLLGIAALGWWARSYLGERFPWWLPPMLLALCPAYLLYIRNCRYYAPGLLWAILLWAAWCAASSPRGPGERTGIGGSGRGRFRLFAAVAMIAMACLCRTHYIYAVSAAAILPFFLVEKRFRTMKSVSLLVGVGVILGVCVLWVYFVINPFVESQGEGGNLVSWLLEKHIFTAFWWQVRDLGYYEYFAWPVLLLLALPWVSPRFGLLRDLARRGWLLVGFLLVILAVTAVLTPELVYSERNFTQRSEIRYALPVLPVGIMITAVGLCVLWNVQRAAAVVVGGVLVFTNLLHLGATSDQLRHQPGKSRVRSTLVDYIGSIAGKGDSAYDGLVGVVKALPEDTSVRFFPFYLTYPPLYEVPQIRYCDPLTDGVAVRPELRAQLPPHVFPDFLPDLCIVHGPLEKSDQPGGGSRLIMEDLPSDLPDFLAKFGYTHTVVVPAAWPIGMRPEIPQRWFLNPGGEDPSSGAFVLFSRTPIVK